MKIYLNEIQIRKNIVQDKCHQWSTRPDPYSHASSEHCFLLFCFSRFEKWGRTYRRTVTDKMCENNDPYRPWLWVGRVDQQFQLLMNKCENALNVGFKVTSYYFSKRIIHWNMSEKSIPHTLFSTSFSSTVHVSCYNSILVERVNWKMMKNNLKSSWQDMSWRSPLAHSSCYY